MASISFNGRTVNLGAGGTYREIHINGKGAVYVDGDVVQEFGDTFSITNTPHITFEGFVGNITVQTASATVNGDVKGNVKAGGSVTCKNVGCSVVASGSITCNSVNANADAGGSMTINGRVGGNVSAGGSIRFN